MHAIASSQEMFSFELPCVKTAHRTETFIKQFSLINVQY